jgi:hypothetical protein
VVTHRSRVNDVCLTRTHSPNEVINCRTTILIDASCQIAHDLLDEGKPRPFLAWIIESYEDEHLLPSRGAANETPAAQGKEAAGNPNRPDP